MSNKGMIILAATVFNLLFEYSLRGINNLPRQPFLPILLISTYASLFTMQEDLIRRFKLKDYHLVILAFTYGSIYQCLVSGSAFVNPTALGINWGSMLFTIIVWWGAIQSVLTFYLANRIRPREWDLPLLSKSGWIAAVIVNLGAIFLFQASGAIPTGRPIGYLTMLGIFALSILVFRISLSTGERSAPAFKSSMFMDLVAGSTVAVFLFSAFFLRGGAIIARQASLVNATAVIVVTLSTICAAMAMLSYRIITQERIPV